MRTKTTITERGYIVEAEGETDTDALATFVKALELSLSDLPSRRGASGKQPGAITACQSSDNETMLTYIAQQEAPRARKYLEDNCPLSARDAKASLTRLIKAGELELRPATFVNAAGSERPMQGVFLTDNVEPEETPKTSFLG